MKENKDYQLIPAQLESDQLWEIRILTGDFVETVIRFGAVSIEDDALHYNFTISASPDKTLTESDKKLQETTSKILQDLIDNSVNYGHIDYERSDG